MRTAQELMTASPAVAFATTSLREAFRRLELLHIRHLPVVDAEGRLLGMLSDRDLYPFAKPYLVADEYVGGLRTTLDADVSCLMSSDVVAVQVGTPAPEIARILVERNVGAVPVVDEERSLLGIVSYVDLLRDLFVDPEPGRSAR
jgi:CBS domain-containing protein